MLAYLEYHLGDWGDVFAESKTAVTIMEAGRIRIFQLYIWGDGTDISDFEDHEKALYWLEKSIMQEPLNKAKRTWYRQFTLTRWILQNWTDATSPGFCFKDYRGISTCYHER